MEKKKRKVLYILQHYPQISETYEHEEIATLWEDYEIKIVSIGKADCPRKVHFPYEFVEKEEASFRVPDIIELFQPDVMHTHWFGNILMLDEFAKTFQVPYTVRTHSFDILSSEESTLMKYCSTANSKWCLKILCFPEFRDQLLLAGIADKKITTSWPVVNYQRFYNPEKPESKGRILNVGAALPKKAYEDYIDLADLMKESGLEFNLYIMGYNTEAIVSYNDSKGKPVRNITMTEPEEMNKVYREHDWLVYTGSKKMNAIGLPMAIAEAQASGIGVCLQELPGRKHALLDYLGGAGFLFRSIEEIPSIITKPYPEEMRLQGLENAKKCDITKHKTLLTDVWDKL